MRGDVAHRDVVVDDVDHDENVERRGEGRGEERGKPFHCRLHPESR